jgi:hypothetical protein
LEPGFSKKPGHRCCICLVGSICNYDGENEHPGSLFLWHEEVGQNNGSIDRDYEAFNEERTAFYKEQSLDPLPASTGIQAHLCRPELLVEIEAIAMFLTGENSN